MSIQKLIVLCFFIIPLGGYAQWDDVNITVNKVQGNVYMLEGRGGNIGLFVGEDMTLLIDDQFAPLSEKIKSAVQSVSDNPIHYIVNTHWHGDHTGGNANFAEMGATIVAHENVRTRLSTEQKRPFRNPTPAAPEAAWPDITFDENLQLHLNGESVQLIHVHNAHTDGDVFVYFPESNVLHMGDCFFKDRFPYVDLGSGGSPDGAIKAVETALMITDQNSKIIPGHGALATRDDLVRFKEMWVTMRSRIKDAITNGRSLEDMKAGMLTEGYDGWGDFFISDEKMIEMLFRSYSEGQ
ncbi:MAG: MBL fold metallo-hydrolase [Saprospiraceae bacterium]|nr:MBL fold metallo-hydrolase [Saprospiraceae bacterium]